jgi:hypothetical protein
LLFYFIVNFSYNHSMAKKYLLSSIILVVALAVAGGIFFWNMRHTSSMPVAQNSKSDCTDTGVTGGGGTIVAISGNHIITNDPYSNQTTTITIGPSTYYYEADLITSVSSSSLLVVGQAVLAGGIGCDWGSNSYPATIDATMSIVSRMTTLSDISAPPGWYAHRVEIGAIVFTKQSQLSIPSATEGFALGEQIDAGAYRLDHPPVDWAWANIGTASGTMGASPAKDWGTLDGYQTIRAPIGMGEEPELIYAVFDPAHYTVYEFTLYPYPNATDTPVFDEIVQNFAKSL